MRNLVMNPIPILYDIKRYPTYSDVKFYGAPYNWQHVVLIFHNSNIFAFLLCLGENNSLTNFITLCCI